jgi:hypothetical protein
MTHDEAEAEAARRNADPEGAGFWAVKEAEAGEWGLIHLTTPGVARIRPTGTHAESRPKPSEPADPRPTIVQNIPPYGAI